MLSLHRRHDWDSSFLWVSQFERMDNKRERKSTWGWGLELHTHAVNKVVNHVESCIVLENTHVREIRYEHTLLRSPGKRSKSRGKNPPTRRSTGPFLTERLEDADGERFFVAVTVDWVYYSSRKHRIPPVLYCFCSNLPHWTINAPVVHWLENLNGNEHLNSFN